MTKETNTKKVGHLSVMKFVTRCLERGWSISLPLGDCDRYDCVLDRNGKLDRVQVKTGQLVNGSIMFLTSTMYKGKRRSYKGDVEVFGVFCPSVGKSYLIPIEEVPACEASLRVGKPKNNQEKDIRYAKNYEI